MTAWIILAAAGAACANDWPQWRGPDRDGFLRQYKTPAPWPGQLTREWKVNVGEGHSSPVVVGDRVYIHTRQGDEEAVLGLNLKTGKKLWRSSYPAPYTMHSAATGHGKGPKSTPVVSDGRLFTLSINGVLSCFDTGTGERLWQREFARQFSKTSPLYGTSMSPMVADGLCIAHVGGHDSGALIAFDVKDGTEKWACDQDGPGYSSPILVQLAGHRQVVTQTQNFVAGFDFKTGERLWKIPFRVAYTENAVTVLPYQDMLIYAGYNHPTVAVRLVEKDGKMTTEEVWSNSSSAMHMSSPVLAGKRLFGMTHRQSGQVFCLDAENGKTLWTGPDRIGDNVAFISTGDFILMLTTESDLIVLKADADKYEPVARYHVADTPTWAHPALVDHQILIKDKFDLSLFTIWPTTTTRAAG